MKRLSPFERIAVVGLGVLAVLVIGGIDYVTGVEIRIYPLYFIPLSLITWRFGRGAGIGFSALCAATWEVSNYQAGMDRMSFLVQMWNTTAQLLAFLVVSLLIAELRDRLEKERALSRTDPLTGLANGQSFRERADLEVSRARRWGRPLTLAYVDLDDFKLVNDRLGHAAGDEVLRAAAVSLRSALRATDLAARLGGDEFALLLPETDCAGARVVLEGALLGVREAMERGRWSVSASIGSVTTAAPADTETLLRQADHLMYEVKRSGKAGVLFTDETRKPGDEALGGR